MAKEKIDVGDVEPNAGFVSAPPKPIRVGRQKREDTEKPDSLNSRLMAKATMLSDRLFERRKELRKSLGEPIKGGKLSKPERKTQYKELIASREMLFNSLAGAAIVGRDGRLRISTAMVDAFVELGGN
jgi:hypothetical protein